MSPSGTFAVEDGGFDVDNGTYTIAGDQISFTSEWVEGHGPLDYGVIWARPACPDCNANPIMRTDKCEGVVGDYTLLFETPGTFSFRVINDECLLRTYVANGMELRLSSSG